MTVLSFSMQGKSIIEHTNGQVSRVCNLVCKRKISLSISILMASFICLHFSKQEEDNVECTNVIRVHYSDQLLDHCIT